MMYALPIGTWWRLGIWTAIRYLIYFVLRRWHLKKPQWKIEEQ